MSRKNKNRAKIRQIAQFMCQLPIELDLEKPLTPAQQDDWNQLNNHFAFVSICWKAKALGEENPLVLLATRREIDKWHCDYFWSHAELWFHLWEIIQLVEPHIQREFKRLVQEDPKTCQAKVEYPFSSNIELLQEILSCSALHDSLICLKPYHEVSYSKMTQAIKLARKKLETKLSQIECKKLEILHKTQAIDDRNLWFWFDLAINTALYKARTDPRVRDRVNFFNCAVDQVAKLRLTAHRKAESDTWKKLYSFAFIRGTRVPASQGGAYLA